MAKQTIETRKSLKLCIYCGKEDDRFPLLMCSKCANKHNARGKIFYRQNKPKILKRTHGYYLENKDKHNGWMRAWTKAHNDKIIEYRLKLKLTAFRMISGQEFPTCAYCPCDDPRFLEINHKKGGGAKEYWVKRSTRASNAGFNFYNEVVRGRRKVDDLEVVCRPHNALHYLKLKYGSDADQFRIVWEPIRTTVPMALSTRHN